MAKAKQYKQKYTTRAQDAAYMAQRFEDVTRLWKVGDKCLSYDLRSETSVNLIEGDSVTLANGDSFHISKLRSSK